jgi:putative transposase
MPTGVRFSAEQMSQIINECNATPRAEVARKYGIHEQTISKWKQKFKNMNVSDIKKMKQMEEELSRLKRIIANITIENDALRELNAKKW